MLPAWEYGDAVRVTRNVRNDGTFPGIAVGELLVRRGSVGHVVNVGTFLVDQLIYSVRFLDVDRIVGCRVEELIGADETWVPSRYEVELFSRRVGELRDDVDRLAARVRRLADSPQ